MLEQALLDNDVDVVVCGHSHRTLIVPVQQVRRDRKTGRTHIRQRWGIMAGAWQTCPGESDLWQDERRLRPARVGGVTITYEPGTGAVSVAA